MAKVEWSTGIDHVSGALSKPGKNDQHSCTKMLLGTHRVAPTESKDCNRLYMRKKTVRNTPLTADELAARARFATVSAMVKARKADLSKLTDDQIAFAAQKDQPRGKKTMKAWYWYVCGQEYDEEQNG